MTNVIKFPARAGDPNIYRDPIFVIEIYQGDGNGFDWVVRSPDESVAPAVEELSDYLGDMFLALNPQPPSVFDRFRAFLYNLRTRPQGD
jgi:alkanesulfonate monooxygenase SsuD/methylene tetrahydromethanopterin reductase-like flavin-dependent oxidoreductase (luciferase family)